MNPRDREVLDYSLRRRVPDGDLATIFGVEPPEVARLRAGAVERLSDSLGVERGEDLGLLLKRLLEAETWALLPPAEAPPEPPSPAASGPKPAAAKPDAPKPEAAKGDAPKPGAAKPAAAKPAGAKPAVAKPDPAKAPAADAPKPEPAKPAGGGNGSAGGEAPAGCR